jgi:hypothetical protein
MATAVLGTALKTFIGLNSKKHITTNKIIPAPDKGTIYFFIRDSIVLCFISKCYYIPQKPADLCRPYKQELLTGATGF